MKHLAEKSGKVPEFYRDPGYTNINHIILSTSTLTSPAVVIGGFGPVTPNGYGVGKKHCHSTLFFILVSLLA